jgi:hypothetical protein
MRRAAIALVASALLSCGEGLHVPPYGPHKGAAFAIVPYPPPPAHAEIVGPLPDDRAEWVWIDGEWQWKGRRWVWKSGEWQRAQPGAYYALPATVRLSNGTLAWFPGRWELIADEPAPGAKPSTPPKAGR